MKTELPPGPRRSALLQTIGAWARPTASMDRNRARYGKRFTIRLLGQLPFVVLSDPDDIKELFMAPPDVLHPGEGASLLEPIVGPNSVILLDEGPHLKQRKLMLPAFHGERMQDLAGLMVELSEREVDSWPLDQTIELHPRLQGLTLEIVLRAVFGLEQGAQLDALRELLTELLAFTESPVSFVPIPKWMAGRGPVGRLERTRAQADELIFALIEERQREGSGGADVLTLLLAAEHDDGSPMSPMELRDELMTALVAGHETTASQLAWAFAELAGEPAVQGRLAEEIHDEDSDEQYLTATINEIMRRRPVLPNAEPRLVKQPIEIGGVSYPPGVILTANAHLLHHDPEIYPDPYAFRPERFLESQGGRAPGTYTWIPFGGGRRRCLGASFALLEMKLVLRAVLQRYELHPTGERPEVARRRGITISPSRGAQVILRGVPARAHRRSAAPRTRSAAKAVPQASPA